MSATRCCYCGGHHSRSQYPLPLIPDPPRQKPRVLMHVTDSYHDDESQPTCRMRCTKCKNETDWLVFKTTTEAKRGIPCPTCNA